MLTVCDVLEHLHNLPQPVIHRDLKPENILIQENGYLKIIDFNTAKQYEDGKDNDTVIIGTRKYAAPEQFGFSQSDARTDIYAMGVLMNYLLTKRYPDEYLYIAESPREKVMSGIIRKCTEFSPDSRYQTATALREELQKVLSWTTDRYFYNYNAEKTGVEKVPRKGRWMKPFLPVGFRTGTIWKMVSAILGYYFIFWLGISLEVTQKDGNAVTGFALWSNRLAFLIWVLLTVAFYGNYLGLRNKLPFMEHKYLRWIGYFLWPMVFLIVVILIIIPISN